MPVTISGDATKRIEALAASLSDERLYDLAIQLRDSLVGTLRNTKWGAGNIGRGLTQYTEPVRTAGGWMVGVGSLEILHREPAPPHTIRDFLEWYRSTYRPAEKAGRKVERKRKYEAEIVAGRRIRVKLDLRRAYKARRNLERAYSDLLEQEVHLNYQRSKLIATGGSPKEIEGIRKRISKIWNERIPKAVERIRKTQKRIDRLMKERQPYR